MPWILFISEFWILLWSTFCSKLKCGLDCALPSKKKCNNKNLKDYKCFTAGYLVKPGDGDHNPSLVPPVFKEALWILNKTISPHGSNLKTYNKILILRVRCLVQIIPIKFTLHRDYQAQNNEPLNTHAQTHADTGTRKAEQCEFGRSRRSRPPEHALSCDKETPISTVHLAPPMWRDRPIRAGSKRVGCLRTRLFDRYCFFQCTWTSTRWLAQRLAVFMLPSLWRTDRRLQFSTGGGFTGCHYLHVLSENSFERLVSVDHGTENQWLLSGGCCYGDAHPTSWQHRQHFIFLYVSDVDQFDHFVLLGCARSRAGAFETQVILCDVKHSIADVICGHLPVSVYQTAPPAILIHC